MRHTIHDIGVASQIGKYSDAVEASLDGRLLVLSGTPDRGACRSAKGVMQLD